MILNTICLKIGNKRVPFTILQGIRTVFFPNVALSHGPTIFACHKFHICENQFCLACGLKRIAADHYFVQKLFWVHIMAPPHRLLLCFIQQFLAEGLLSSR